MFHVFCGNRDSALSARTLTVVLSLRASKAPAAGSRSSGRRRCGAWPCRPSARASRWIRFATWVCRCPIEVRVPPPALGCLARSALCHVPSRVALKLCDSCDAILAVLAGGAASAAAARRRGVHLCAGPHGQGLVPVRLPVSSRLIVLDIACAVACTVRPGIFLASSCWSFVCCRRCPLPCGLNWISS